MLRTQLLRVATSLLAALLAAFALPVVASDNTLTVARVSGSVKVLAGEKPIAVSAGSLLSAPVKIETGADGFLRIEQASSNLDIGPNSVLLIPVANADSENIIQNLGRVLYSVKPRKSRSFSVQTPYLVSVVKGTVFSVAIENEATTVSLMEGSVELVADDIAPVLLLPNDTARRGEHDRSINVTKVDTSAPAAGPQAATLGSGSVTSDSNGAPSLALASETAFIGDLNEIIAAHRAQASSSVVPESPSPAPPSPPVPAQPDSPPPAEPPVTPEPEQPTPEPSSTPLPEVPDTQPEVPAPDDDDDQGPDLDDDSPGDDDDDDDDANSCARNKCDSDQDHDRGGGNDRR